MEENWTVCISSPVCVPKDDLWFLTPTQAPFSVFSQTHRLDVLLPFWLFSFWLQWESLKSPYWILNLVTGEGTKLSCPLRDAFQMCFLFCLLKLAWPPCIPNLLSGLTFIIWRHSYHRLPPLVSESSRGPSSVTSTHFIFRFLIVPGFSDLTVFHGSPISWTFMVLCLAPESQSPTKRKIILFMSFRTFISICFEWKWGLW